jgi:hypothetical protein
VQQVEQVEQVELDLFYSFLKEGGYGNAKICFEMWYDLI